MGYLGMVGAPDVCSDAYLRAHYSSPYTYGCVSFENSPYGLTNDLAATGTLIPYLINAATLDIEYRPDLAVSMPGNLSGQLLGLDASTIVAGDAAGWSLYVISRSGIAISVSGPQRTISTSGGPAFLARIDSAHFVRSYDTSLGHVLEVLSVSGGTISLVHTETIAGPQTATVDPSGLLSAMSNGFEPFHYNAGTLYAYGSATASSPTLFGPAILALPFSIGGGIGGAITPTTRAKDQQSTSFSINRPTKIGSSECLLQSSTGYSFPFYDDGTHMHTGALSSSGMTFGPIGDGGDLETTQGNYLTDSVSEFPAGHFVVSGPALVTQSGITTGYTPISPVFLCPGLTTHIGGQRHTSNLGAMVVGSGFGPGILIAYKW